LVSEWPAIIDADGTQKWYQNGKWHRDNDLPAIIYADGSQVWYQNGEIHRDNDQPAIILANGYQAWYHNGIEIKGIKLMIYRIFRILF